VRTTTSKLAHITPLRTHRNQQEHYNLENTKTTSRTLYNTTRTLEHVQFFITQTTSTCHYTHHNYFSIIKPISLPLKLENHHIATASRYISSAATKSTCRTQEQQEQYQEQMNSYRKTNTNYTKMRLNEPTKFLYKLTHM
jgi:hypothetical protein